MQLEECLSHLAARRSGELVVTSAGTASAVWWELTHDTDATFYLEASMGMASLAAAGIALAVPAARVWAFNGDGAFAMNPGCLMVENTLRPPNLIHFLVSNRCYGATGELDLPNAAANDFALMARSMGVEAVHRFAELDALQRDFDRVVSGGAYAFVLLEVERLKRRTHAAPFQGPELKRAFGLHIQRTFGVPVFGDT